jgi:D-alanine transaminase
MSRVAYVNGRYLPYRHAAVHVEDRGYQFADGVYEVVAVHDGRFIGEEPHLDRLERSLAELQIEPPMSRAALRVITREVRRRNGVHNGIVYMQITRGVAPRDHPFPANAKTSIVLTASQKPRPSSTPPEDGVRAITVPDIRWGRCDIKSVSLLPNILAKQVAREAGAYEAWMVDRDGFVTEGTSTNAWIVTRDGDLVTRDLSESILSGITRLALLQLLQQGGLNCIERAFTVEEARTAREAFLTSSTSFVKPIVQIDDAVIGNGKPGSITRQIYEIYAEYMTNGALDETGAA